MIFYLPLEHIDMRYTTHMDRDIKKYLTDSGKDFVCIDPVIENISPVPPKNCFLNAPFTSAYKSMQIAKLAEFFYNETISDGDTIFISDLWYPGIESIAYMCHFQNIKVNIRGILHAGSFTDTDEVREMERWAKNFEDIIFDITDTIYVGSDFIKQDVIKKRIVDPNKIVVTGLPLDYDGLNKFVPAENREDIVVFNGRIHDEKQPWLFEQLEEKLGYKAKFICTHKENYSKDEYYDLLSRAKVIVSYALQENFGFGIAEAVELGCHPILPNRLVYPEFYDDKYLYNNFHESVEMVEKVLDGVYEPTKVSVGQSSIPTWFKGVK